MSIIFSFGVIVCVFLVRVYSDKKHKVGRVTIDVEKGGLAPDYE